MEAPAPEVASGTASTPRRAVADAPAHQAEADVVMEGAAPEAPGESIADVDPAGAEPAGPSGAASAADAMDLEPALDLAELEAQGLGGASVWISGFSNKLRTLRGGASQSTVELLLKLVRNVVNNPSDPKFRRIRADNPKIRTGLLSAGEAAETLMRMLGFEPVEDGSARVFVLREAALDTARLLMGKELLEMELKGVTVAGAA
uniref:PUB domain-containing protein n=1 Tax=Zooxanthella nutricula TaxID=1333877 RepID=A0A7S2KH13_9DINO